MNTLNQVDQPKLVKLDANNPLATAQNSPAANVALSGGTRSVRADASRSNGQQFSDPQSSQPLSGLESLNNMSNLNTPQRMWALMILIGICGIFFLSTIDGAIKDTRHAVQVIGKDSVPSIVAAEDIRANLADMNANATNEFLCRGKLAQEAHATYESERHSVSRSLIGAAQNITYGDEERVPILKMLNSLEVYCGLIETARSYRLSDSAQSDVILSNADGIMHSELLPAAVQLDAANFKYLDAAYSKRQAQTQPTIFKTYLAGALMLAALLAAQIYLRLKTNRLFSLPLVGATAIVVVFVSLLSSTLASESKLLKTAKVDAFDSIHALSRARAVAYDANADESLYLIERQQKARYEQDFMNKTHLLFDTPLSAALLSSIHTQVQQHAPRACNMAGGLFADELNNITFIAQGEDVEATKLIDAYAKYVYLDAQIRRLEETGKHDAAIEFCIGNDPGQSNWAFDQFMAILDKTIQINQGQFDESIEKAFDELSPYDLLAVVCTLLVCGLAACGLHMRIREYAA